MDATPTATAVPARIAEIHIPVGMSLGNLAKLLASMPYEVAGLTRRRVQTGADNVTVMYLAGEESGQPKYGLIVALEVPERDDADKAIVELQLARWGNPSEQTLTASSPGTATTSAFREFWRTFPPGLFAIPNQPVYFLLFYRALAQHAFMVIAASPIIRTALTSALADTVRAGLSPST